MTDPKDIGFILNSYRDDGFIQLYRYPDGSPLANNHYVRWFPDDVSVQTNVDGLVTAVGQYSLRVPTRESLDGFTLWLLDDSHHGWRTAALSKPDPESIGARRFAISECDLDEAQIDLGTIRFFFGSPK